jgi:hypothetical protein
MNDVVPANVFDDDMMEFLPPERNAWAQASVHLRLLRASRGDG